MKITMSIKKKTPKPKRNCPVCEKDFTPRSAKQTVCGICAFHRAIQDTKDENESIKNS